MADAHDSHDAPLFWVITGALRKDMVFPCFG